MSKTIKTGEVMFVATRAKNGLMKTVVDGYRPVYKNKNGEYFVLSGQRYYIYETVEIGAFKYGMIIAPNTMGGGLVDKNSTMFGWKMLNQFGATAPNKYCQGYTRYTLPANGEKWGKWMRHPNPSKIYDGNDCGHGGYHITIGKAPTSYYAPDNWWPWFAQIRGVIGKGAEKARGQEIRLRFVRPEVFWKIISLGRCNNGLLDRVELTGAIFKKANIRNVSFDKANMNYVKASNSNIYGCHFYDASMKRSSFESCILAECRMSGADLSDSTFRETSIVDTAFEDVNLGNVTFAKCDMRHVDFSGSIIPKGKKVYLYDCDIRGAIIPKGIRRKLVIRNCNAGILKIRARGRLDNYYKTSGERIKLLSINETSLGLRSGARQRIIFHGLKKKPIATLEFAKEMWKLGIVLEVCYYRNVDL